MQGYLFCQRYKFRAVSDTFKVACDNFGFRILAERPDKIKLVDIGFIADANQPAKAYAAGVGHVKNGRKKSTRLRKVTNASLDGQIAAKAGINFTRCFDNAKAVGAYYPDAGLPGYMYDLFL